MWHALVWHLDFIKLKTLEILQYKFIVMMVLTGNLIKI